MEPVAYDVFARAAQQACKGRIAGQIVPIKILQINRGRQMIEGGLQHVQSLSQIPTHRLDAMQSLEMPLGACKAGKHRLAPVQHMHVIGPLVIKLLLSREQKPEYPVGLFG